ncbi:hypothetical protein O988_02372 [Pseudogymnoascus sp. VKM F-3808]|nr:hypothetical protein O988_02372 [Pseudogymnoascus sp. VKM F-3808]
MDSFALLYFLYGAKICSQTSIYFIWLLDSSNRTITFTVSVVAILAVFPFFHVITHVFLAKPLSSQAFVAYLCISLVLAILWYKPTQDGQHRSLSFALVTSFDLFDALLFLFQRQIIRCRSVLSPDIEQEHIGLGHNDGALLASMGERDRQAKVGTARSPSELRRLQILKDIGYTYSAFNPAGMSTTTIETDPQSVTGHFTMQPIRSSGKNQMPGVCDGMRRPGSPTRSFANVQVGDDCLEGRSEEGGGGFVISESLPAGSETGDSRPQTPITAINTNLHQPLRPDTYYNTNINLLVITNSAIIKIREESQTCAGQLIGFFQEEQNEKPTLLRAYSATTRPRKHHSNKPYTPDQIRFIQCKRDNEDMPWMRVTEEYNRAFPGYYRSRSGLEARYYREQLSEPNGNTGFAGFESTT